MTLFYLVSSKFCQNWAQVLLIQGTNSPDPFFLKQALDNYKLKVRGSQLEPRRYSN